MSEHEGRLIDAIRRHCVVRLGYSRQGDGVLSLHYVAPVDIRPGETPRTAATLYLWAYCFDESEAEMHLIERVLSATITEQVFEPADVLGRWPKKWPLPTSWVVTRDW